MRGRTNRLFSPTQPHDSPCSSHTLTDWQPSTNTKRVGGRNQWIHIVPESSQRQNRSACSEVIGWETEVIGIVFPSPGEPAWHAVPTSARVTSAPRKKKVSVNKRGGREKGRGATRERGGVHCLFTFPQITLVAGRHKFRNLNEKTLILLCRGGCDLWRVCCLTYNSAVTQVNSTDNKGKYMPLRIERLFSCFVSFQNSPTAKLRCY